MSSELVFCIGLALLILTVASFTIGVKEDFAAVVGFVVYGLLLSLAWMSLSSPDVALTEAAVGERRDRRAAAGRLRTAANQGEDRLKCAGPDGLIGARLSCCAPASQRDWRALCCSFLIRRPPLHHRRESTSWQRVLAML